MKKLLYIAFLALCIASCNREEPDDYEFILVADREVIEAGETVNFTLYHNCELLTVYSGAQGENYKLSAAYILKDATNEDLYYGNIDRVEDPDSYGCVLSMDDYEVGDLQANKGISLYYATAYSTAAHNYGSAVESDFASKPLVAKISEDYEGDANGDNVLKLVNQSTTDLSNYFVHFEPKTALTSNRTLSIRVRTNAARMYKSNVWVDASETNCMYFYVRLNCVLKDGSETLAYWIDNPNSLGSQATAFDYVPSTEYTTMEYDLSNHIRNWASANGVEEEEIDYVDFIEFNIKTASSSTFMDEMYISDISYSGQSYYDYDLGTSLIISDNSGIYHWSYTYEDAGVYEPTFIGKTFGSKNNYGSLGSAYESDYNVNTTIATKSILVQ